MQLFVDVILPIPLGKTYTYLLDDKFSSIIKPGFRVIVPFGKSKIYTAVVSGIHSEKPELYEAKPIILPLEENPSVTIAQIEFWKWISKYYICTLGEVMRASIPSALLLESESQIVKKSFDTEKMNNLSNDQFLIYEALDSGPLRISDIISITQKKNVMPIIQQMIASNIVELNQKLTDKYKPKMVRYIRLHKKYQVKNNLEELFISLKSSPKQLDCLMVFLDNNLKPNNYKKVENIKKTATVSSSIFKILIEKNIFTEKFFREDRILIKNKISKKSKISLSELQSKALRKIKKEFIQYNTVLFEGVTSSGKTEIYTSLIEEQLEKGNQVLYLLPEISLTSQIVERLSSHFGSKVSVYHSRFSINERTEVWKNLISENEKARVIVGARSSVLLPFKKLGLIIVDEEHEVSYKQFDPSPRYNARDCAVYLSKSLNAKTLLGTATPSVESADNARKGKYGWVKLKERYGGVELPKIEIIDLKEAYRKKRMEGVFSKELIHEIRKTLEMKKQLILFHNRRGYSPFLECLSCGYTPQCSQCDVSLTYHQTSNKLCCHYCGYNVTKPIQCNACGMINLNTKGVGTQQIQEQIQNLFPEIEVARMDFDSTKGKWGFDKIIQNFSDQKTQILVGTQMVVKGLDFKNVHLVGVLNADHLINFPDFRSHERSFQMLCQVAGRSGRASDRGKVLLQTFQPDHELLKQVVLNDFDSMYKDQALERKKYKYPPFCRIIRVTFKNKNINTVNLSSEWFTNVLKKNYRGTVLGPVFPYVSRIRNLYNKQLLVKIDSNLTSIELKILIKKINLSFQSISIFRSTRISFDVDPY